MCNGLLRFCKENRVDLLQIGVSAFLDSHGNGAEDVMLLGRRCTQVGEAGDAENHLTAKPSV